MSVRRSRRRGSILTVTLGAVALTASLTGCSGGDSGSAADATSTPTTATRTPVTQPTGSPFTASLSGPQIAKAGDTITVTITNTGRLPNDFQLSFRPASAATADPASVALQAGQSAPITVHVVSAPFDVNLEAASGGLGNYLDTLEVGANS